MHGALFGLQKVKDKKTKEGKKIKKHKTVVEEEPDCEPVPKKKKKKKEKVDKANGDVNKSIDVNGNIESHLKNNTSYSNEESADNNKATEVTCSVLLKHSFTQYCVTTDGY